MKKVKDIEELKHEMPSNPGDISDRVSSEGIQKQFDTGLKMRENRITIHFLDGSNICRLKFNRAGKIID